MNNAPDNYGALLRSVKNDVFAMKKPTCSALVTWPHVRKTRQKLENGIQFQKVLIGLRFASDDEVADLITAVVSEGIKDRTEIKKRVKNWRPDHQRV